ncbi:MAG: CehA/McbA family metallohydrolase [Acidobacteriota bacterium]
MSARAIGAIQPRISPDGTSIVVSYQGAIWRMARHGGKMKRLTSAVGFDSNPAWSADGKRIAYFGGSELRVIDAETGASIALSIKLQGSGKLYFHPDGRRVLGNFSQAPGLSWVDLQIGTLTKVVKSTRRVDVFGLSPDGLRIVYRTTQDLDGEQDGYNGPQADVWVIPSDGGEAKKLLQFRSRIFDLWWGREQLTVASDLGGAHNDLWTISLDDPSRVHRITSGQADEDSASTSADGRWLVYTDNREGATALVCRELETGAEQALPITRMEFGVPTGTLQIRLVEKGSGAPLTARVSIQQQDGKYFAPAGALYRILGNVEHFYAAGEADVTVPSGRYVIRAFRGTEYLEARAEVDVPVGARLAARLELERWTDPPARGWWGGESHIHANYGYGQWYNTPATMRLQIEGEGLNLANMVVANSDTDGIFDREFFRGEPDPVSSPRHVLYWNEEFRSTLWGHMTLYNLKRLVEPIMTGFKGTTNPWDVPTNADIADHAHQQGGHVNYTHPASNADPFLAAYSAKALPVDVALGKIDSLDINGSYDATVPLWHRLLNCGFRLPASAGTDVFLNRIRSRLPGGDRAYIHLDDSFSYDAWVKGLKTGRSFVTNGPMLEFTANGKSLGETLALAAPGQVRVQAKAHSAAPISRIEVVYNGVVVAEGLPGAVERGAVGRGAAGHSESLDQTLLIEKSGWLGARVYGSGTYNAGTTQAHTSPIYVEVAGRRTSSKEDAAYFLEWIDRLEAKFVLRDRAPSPELRARVTRQLDDARAAFRKAAR